MKRKTLASLAWASLGYLLIILILYGQALSPEHLLSPSDYLLINNPWKSSSPPEFEGPRNRLLSDHTSQFLPNLYYFRRSVAEGRLPLWNPHIMAGKPFLANMQSAVFFPLTWIALLVPVPSSITWMVIAKVFLGCLGFFLFCWKALKIRPVPAFAGGVVFGLCGFNTVWLLYPSTNVSLLAGWLLLALDRLLRKPCVFLFVGLAFLVALVILAGHPETTLHLLLLTLIYLVVVCFANPPGWLRRLILPALACVTGVLLSSVALIPFMESGLESATWERRVVAGQRAAAKGTYGLPWTAAVVLLMPDATGNPTTEEYRGPGNYNEVSGFASVGIWILAVAAFFNRRRQAALWFGALTVAFSVAVVYGVWPIDRILHALPLYGRCLNIRLLFGISMGAAVLGAVGLDLLTEHRRWAGSRVLALLTLPVALALAGLVWMVVAPLYGSELSWEHGIKQLLWFVFPIGGGVALLLATGKKLLQIPVTLAWVALIATEMIRFSFGYNPVIPTRHFAYETTPPALRFLQSKGVDRFVGMTSRDLIQNSALVYETYDFRGYDPPEPLNYNRYFTELVDDAKPNIIYQVDRLSEDTVVHLSNAGVRYYAGETALDHPDFRPVHSGDVRIYEQRKAQPRAYIPARVVEVHSDQEALQLLKTNRWLATEVTVISRQNRSDALSMGRADLLQGERTPLAGNPGEGRGDVRIVSYDPERVVLEADATGSEWLVLTDLFYPGWKAEVNSQPADIYAANGLFRAVVIPPGRSRIEFIYDPLSFRIGSVLSLIALALLSGLLLMNAARRVVRNQGRQKSNEL